MAVQELFPGTQVTIGPVIENGFYYDFARKEPFTEDDLEKIENKMKEIVDRDEITKREVWERDKAIQHFKEKGEIYKAEIIEAFPENEDVSIYFMENGMTYVEGHIYLQLEKLENFLNLQKFLELIGEETLIMKCCKEYMEQAGQPKRLRSLFKKN